MTVTPQQSVVEVMELMIDNNFRHVPVVCALGNPITAALVGLHLPVPGRALPMYDGILLCASGVWRQLPGHGQHT